MSPILNTVRESADGGLTAQNLMKTVRKGFLTAQLNRNILVQQTIMALE